MKVKIRVPATSANLGPGFDVAGLALTLYNTFTFELKFYNLTTHQANMENEILSGYIYAKKTNCENIP